MDNSTGHTTHVSILQLRTQNLFLSPEEVIYSSMATFGNIIKELSVEQQECCR